MIKILLIGDIFGNKGIEAVESCVPKLRSQLNLDLVIANAENTTNGKSLNKADFNKLKNAKIDFFTMGNHT
jgi:calcineurin-like phosphoesterase